MALNPTTFAVSTDPTPVDLKYFTEDQIYPTALRGTILPVLEEFNRTPDSILTQNQRALKKRYLDRFLKKIEKNESSPSLAQMMIKAHEKYWRKVLTEEISIEDGYVFWFNSLNTIAKKFDRDFSPFSEENAEALTGFLTLKLKDQGIYAQMGRTIPHMDLLLWKTQTTKIYPIDLGDAFVEVPVVIMDDFETFGWLGYATFEHKYTGGWATNDSLHCVAPAYDFTSEKFQVSYLAHEARHFSDYKKFPNLRPFELEYRAKLTELSKANTTLKALLLHFSSEAHDDPSSPHAYASHLVIKSLTQFFKQDVMSEWIQTANADEINDTAKKLLGKHNQELSN